MATNSSLRSTRLTQEYVTRDDGDAGRGTEAPNALQRMAGRRSVSGEASHGSGVGIVDVAHGINHTMALRCGAKHIVNECDIIKYESGRKFGGQCNRLQLETNLKHFMGLP
jgi:hypothetical protein